MRTPSRLFAVALLVLGVACGLYLQSPAAAQDKPKEKVPAAAVTKWEYRIVSVRHGEEKEAEKELNKLAEEGFEIVFVTGGQVTRAIAPLGRAGGGGGGGDSTPIFHYTLKRAKQ